MVESTIQALQRYLTGRYRDEVLRLVDRGWRGDRWRTGLTDVEAKKFAIVFRARLPRMFLIWKICEGDRRQQLSAAGQERRQRARPDRRNARGGRTRDMRSQLARAPAASSFRLRPALEWPVLREEFVAGTIGEGGDKAYRRRMESKPGGDGVGGAAAEQDGGIA